MAQSCQKQHFDSFCVQSYDVDVDEVNVIIILIIIIIIISSL